jgi:hypothetical protein
LFFSFSSCDVPKCPRFKYCIPRGRTSLYLEIVKNQEKIMSMKKYKSLAVLVVLLTLSGLATEPKALADGYLGGLIGVGSSSGDAYNTNSGLALGATLGFHLVPGFGVAGTYLHTSLNGVNGAPNVGESQLLAEANIFTLFFLQGGVHLGEVTESVGSFSTTDMGFGAHLGIDIKIVENISVGAVGYWTYDTESNNKHSLFNLMVPLKYWF